jgi:indole-3-glycerol phosphate synthase
VTVPGVLGQILSDTRARLEATDFDQDALERGAEAARPAPSARDALLAPGTRIIAEVKRQSPSQGVISTGSDPARVARAYEGAGAAAVSVLTEPNHFGGSLGDLAAVSQACSIPTLRKDFIVSRRQLLEARIAGASMVLLIVAALSPEELRRLHGEALALGLTPLVETHTADEVRMALGVGAEIVGINSRNLVTLDVDLAVAESLRDLVPESIVAIAESGIRSPADLRRLHRGGFDVFLIGSALMASDDPGAALAQMLEAP